MVIATWEMLSMSVYRKERRPSAAVWHGLCTATSMFLPSRLSTACVARTAKGMMRGRGVIRVVRQAKRSNAMQQIIVSRNDKEDVWIETPTGHWLPGGFFYAPGGTAPEVAGHAERTRLH